MKTGYITDRFSTLSGLSSVAYGAADSFRDVQNQIISASPTRIFDTHRPSDIFQGSLISETHLVETVISALQEEYSSNEIFGDYIDEVLGANWVERIRPFVAKDLYLEADLSSDYGSRLEDYVLGSLKRVFPGHSELLSLRDKVISSILSDPALGTDVRLVALVASNNPHSKLSTPPPDSVVVLLESIDLDRDHRGISFSTGYLTPQDYQSEVAYPGFSNSTSVPSTFKDSVLDGYVGYPPGTLMEQVFNPAGSESVRDTTLSSVDVLSDSDVWNASSVLGQLADIPGLMKGDRDIYEISLIGPRINNLLSFDPSTMSNGDYFDTSSLPKILNADGEDGVPMSSRNFSNTF